MEFPSSQPRSWAAHMNPIVTANVAAIIWLASLAARLLPALCGIDMGSKLCLTVVQSSTDTDSIISAHESGFPILKGDEPEHLACGACQDVLAWNLSSQTLSAMFIVAHRLLFRCRCGALNLVPTVRFSSRSPEG